MRNRHGFHLPSLRPMAPAQVTAQSKDLIPQKTDKGVLFQCSAPGATSVYLAGDFNKLGQQLKWSHHRCRCQDDRTPTPKACGK